MQQSLRETRPAAPRRTIRTYSILQHWTLAHAYLANMGGLLHAYPEGRCLDKDTRYYALTSAKLGRAYDWRSSAGHHPLFGLILSKDDIADKSKADWLVKSIAVVQITWLTLTVLARGVLGQPVTQLEIATTAFSIFAIVTYVVNFWKPKDVSQPILLQCLVHGYDMSRDIKHYDYTQSLVSRLSDPVLKREWTTVISDIVRVKNDMIWMPNDGIPLVFSIMAVSAFVFGGLHCLAWNFEFPSQAERILWRTTGVASALVPVLSLFASFCLSYMATTHVDKLLASWLAAKLECVARFPQNYLELLKVPLFRHWSDSEVVLLMSQPAGTRNFDERPVIQAAGQRDETPNVIIFLEFFNQFFTSWEDAKNGTHPRLVYSLLSSYEVMERYFTKEVQELLDDYEESYLRKRFVTGDNEPPRIKCVSHMMAILEQLPAEGDKVQRPRDVYNQISRYLVIGSGILYIVVRIIILILLFTCLRAVPLDVYEGTPWTRFLPNFS
jgi:hypothetical protein